MFRIFTSNSSAATAAPATINEAGRHPATRIRHNLAIAIAAVVIGSASAASANVGGTFGARTSDIRNAAIEHKDDERIRVARLPWPAPVGHRQPRANDVPPVNQSSTERDRLLDKKLDEKLVICRGC
jgi:hypothetical protein